MEREMNLKRKRSPSSSSLPLVFEEEEETEDGVVMIDDDDDVYENRKMEKFYELIRTLRDARGQFCNPKTTGRLQQQQQQDHQDNKEQMKKKETTMMRTTSMTKIEEEEKPVWVPSFKREDFSKEIEFRNAAHPPPPPPLFLVTLFNEDQKGEKKEARSSLDLKLTL